MTDPQERYLSPRKGIVSLNQSATGQECARGRDCSIVPPRVGMTLVSRQTAP